MTPERKKKILRILGYCTLAVISFVIFLYRGLPLDRFVPKVKGQIERQGPVLLNIGAVRSGWFLDVIATDIEIFMKPGRGVSEPEKNSEPVLILDRLHIGLKPLTLLLGKLALSLDITLYGGAISGDVAMSSKEIDVDLQTKGVNVALHPMLPDKYGLNPEGKLVGQVRLAMPANGNFEKFEGDVDLKLENASFAESNIMGMQKIPQTKFSDAGIKFVASEGEMKVEKFGLKGEDFSVGITGDVKLQKSFSRSSLNANIDLSMSKNFEGGLDGLVTSMLANSRQSEGKYGWTLTGTVGRWRAMPRQ